MTHTTTPEAPTPTPRARRYTAEYLGVRFTRKTFRTYSHVIVGEYLRRVGGELETWTPAALTWCGRPDLVAKQLAYYQGRTGGYRNVVAVPVVLA